MNELTLRLSALIRKVRLAIHQSISELRLIEQSCDPDHEQYDADHDSDKPEREGEVLAAIKAIQVAQDSAEAKKYALDHRRYRLEWKGHRVAKWGFLALVAYTTVTSIIAIYSIRSANAAKESADTSARQLELTQRPWVFVKDAKIVSPLTFDKEGAHVTFEIVVRNSGPSPAVNIDIQPRLEPFTAAHQPCDAYNYNVAQMRFMRGLMLFPNMDSLPQRITVSMSEKEVDQNTKMVPRSETGGSEVGVLAIAPHICVLYRPTFRRDGPGYSSEMRYWFWSINSPHGPSVPAGSIPLIENAFFGEDAR